MWDQLNIKGWTNYLKNQRACKSSQSRAVNRQEFTEVKLWETINRGCQTWQVVTSKVHSDGDIDSTDLQRTTISFSRAAERHSFNHSIQNSFYSCEQSIHNHYRNTSCKHGNKFISKPGPLSFKRL